jgi:hypothetical protein
MLARRKKPPISIIFNFQKGMENADFLGAAVSFKSMSAHWICVPDGRVYKIEADGRVLRTPFSSIY